MTTGHGAQVPTREALTWAGGNYRLFATVLDSMKAIVAYSSCPPPGGRTGSGRACGA